MIGSPPKAKLTVGVSLHDVLPIYHPIMALIFDFDGTLANTLDLILDLYNEHITRQFSCKVFDKSKIEEFRMRRPASFLRDFGVTPLKLPFIIFRVRKLMKEHITEAQLFAGMKEVLHILHEDRVKV